MKVGSYAEPPSEDENSDDMMGETLSIAVPRSEDENKQTNVRKRFSGNRASTSQPTPTRQGGLSRATNVKSYAEDSEDSEA